MKQLGLIQCFNNIKREAEKKSVLSSNKIDKNDYFKGEVLIPLDIKFTYFHLGKPFQKQVKMTEM